MLEDTNVEDLANIKTPNIKKALTDVISCENILTSMIMEVLLSKKKCKNNFSKKTNKLMNFQSRKDSILRNINLHSRVGKQPSNNMTTLNVGGEKYDAYSGVE